MQASSMKLTHHNNALYWKMSGEKKKNALAQMRQREGTTILMVHFNSVLTVYPILTTSLRSQ
jgi:hypothetical protein